MEVTQLVYSVKLKLGEMIEEQEIDSLKRKNRLADQNMLSNINGEIDEDSQLVLDDDRKQTPLKMKHKM